MIKHNIINDIKGFLDQEEGMRLYEIALKASKLAPCLEIGSYCGKSTAYLGSACKENNSILFSIDHHRGSEEQQPGEEYFDPDLFDQETQKIDTFKLFRKTLELADIQENVIPIVSKSYIAAKSWSTPLSMVFIDGGHTYEAAFTDYNSWARHIIPNGYLLVHDIFKDPSEGGQAPYYVYETAKSSNFFKELPMVKTLGVLQRLECSAIPDNLPGK